MLLFRHSTMSITLYIAYGMFFLHLWRDSCKIFVHYITNSWRTVCSGIQVHALRITMNWAFGELWADVWVAL